MVVSRVMVRGEVGSKRDVQIMHAHGTRIMTDENGEDCMYLVISRSKLAKAKKRRLKFSVCKFHVLKM